MAYPPVFASKCCGSPWTYEPLRTTCHRAMGLRLRNAQRLGPWVFQCGFDDRLANHSKRFAHAQSSSWFTGLVYCRSAMFFVAACANSARARGLFRAPLLLTRHAVMIAIHLNTGAVFEKKLGLRTGRHLRTMLPAIASLVCQ